MQHLELEATSSTFGIEASVVSASATHMIVHFSRVADHEANLDPVSQALRSKLCTTQSNTACLAKG